MASWPQNGHRVRKALAGGLLISEGWREDGEGSEWVILGLGLWLLGCKSGFTYAVSLFWGTWVYIWSSFLLKLLYSMLLLIPSLFYIYSISMGHAFAENWKHTKNKLRFPPSRVSQAFQVCNSDISTSRRSVQSSWPSRSQMCPLLWVLPLVRRRKEWTPQV